MDSNIYIEKYIKKDLSLDFNKLGKNIDEIVLQKLKDDFEGYLNITLCETGNYLIGRRNCL